MKDGVNDVPSCHNGLWLWVPAPRAQLRARRGRH
ncbi:hypothetical protein BRAS3843_1900005 [Bradyrhizobium sp. STM 3843]|nr:hypothetical protein BRAS3843_1900005 [Bradyrhizobium sp. STM 3843]